MSKAHGAPTWGFVGIVLGGALKIFADDVDTPVVSLGKVGVVLLVVGVVELLYGLHLVARGERRA